MDLSRFMGLDIVLICGLPGAGKSHFAREHFGGGEWKRINRKELRRLVYEMTNFGDEWKEDYFDSHDEHLVKYVERRICEHMLEHRRKIIVDNTSVTASSRAEYVKMADGSRKSIGAIFINTPLQKCLERNRTGAAPVPDIVISNLFASIDLPDEREGFRRVLVLDDY